MLNVGNPPHPGELLLDGFLNPLELSRNDCAIMTNLTYRKINELINGNRKMNTEVAASLSLLFNTGMDFWFKIQRDYDLSRDTAPRRQAIKAGILASDLTPEYSLTYLEDYCAVRRSEFIKNRNSKGLGN